MKSYGRAPTFLMMTGYEQVRSIVAEIAGDKDAAERVELVLPETGVCSRPLTLADESVGCCGGSAPAGVDACCQKDADAKAAGAQGLRLLVTLIEFYFDFASPYGFLAAMQVERCGRWSGGHFCLGLSTSRSASRRYRANVSHTGFRGGARGTRRKAGRCGWVRRACGHSHQRTKYFLARTSAYAIPNVDQSTMKRRRK
jgi:hypothetical protein